MTHKLKKMLTSDFFKNVGKLASGTMVAQVITFATLPIIARLYSQEAFGLLAIFSAVVAFISSFATLKYDAALVLPKDDKHAYALLKLSNIVTILITTVCVFFMFLPIPYFESYKSLQILIGIGVLLSVNYNNSALWNIRYKNFNYTAISAIIQAAAVFLFQLLLYKYFELKGLILGNLIGIAVSGIYLIYTRKSDWIIYKRVTKKDMLDQGKRYIDFPKYFTASNAILSFSASLPIFLFIKYISLAQIGMYGIALRIINHPVSLIANSVRSVILSDFALRKNGNKPILKSYIKILIGLFFVSLVGVAALIVFGNFIITIILGEEWIEAALYAKMLAPLLVGMMIAAPATAAVRVFEMQRYNFIYSVISLIVKLITLLILFSLSDMAFRYIILIYSFVSLGLIVGNILSIFMRIKEYDKYIKKN